MTLHYAKSILTDFKCNTFLVLVCIFLFLSSSFASAQQSVLILNSYHPGKQFQDNIISEIFSQLKQSVPDIEIFVEHMDTKRHSSTDYIDQTLFNLYRYKYQYNQPDILITADNNALNFALKHRKVLFPNIPILFCGINGFTDDMLQEHKDISGIVEALDYTSTIKLALKLHPNTQTIIGIADTSLSGELMLKEFVEAVKLMNINIPVLELKGFGEDELATTLSTFDPINTLLFPLTYYKMPSGKVLSYKQANQVFHNSGLPTYTGYSTDIDNGLLGGAVIDGQYHGKIIGEMAQRVLLGEDINDIEILRKSPVRYKFDFNQLKRFDISESDLPQNTIFINKTVSTYQKNKVAIWTVSAVIAALLMMVASLSWAVYQRDHARKALLESDQRLNAAQKIGKVISWEYYPDNNLFWLSNDTESILEHPLSQTPSLKDAIRLIHPDDIREALSFVNSTLETGKEQSAEFRVVTKTGKTKTFYVICSLANNKQGQERQITGVCFDITLQKNAEKALANEKALLSSMIRSIPDILFFKDNNGVYLGCNKKFEAFTGKSERYIVGKNDLELFPQLEGTSYQERDRAVFESGETKRNEEWITYPNGEQRLMDVLKTPYLGPNGEMLGLIGIGRDITLLKKIEEDLAQERNLLAITFASIGEGVISTDLEGNVTFISEQACALTGWKQDQAVGQHISKVAPILKKDNKEQPLPKIMLTTSQQKTLSNRATLLTKDGKPLKIFQSCSPLHHQKTLVGCVLVFRDISDLEFLENESLKVSKLESLGILAGGIAHDFNNILSAILGNIEMAKIMTKGEEKPKTLLKSAEQATRRAAKLTQQLLTFSKGGTPVKESTSLPELIQESANFILHGSNIATSFNFAKDLWLVNADSGQLSQVIQNIVINAKQAMPNGGNITINCSNAPKENMGILYDVLPKDCVRIQIHDTGPGISEAIQDKVFDPYFSTKEDGSGLGLTICHSVIAKHGGHIIFESGNDGGSSITIFLPASITPATLNIIGEQEDQLYSNLRILIMDDEEDILNIVEQQLAFLGHQAIPTKTGEEAIEVFEEQQKSSPIDIAIMDLTIKGGMGGKETAEKLLENYPAAKIIVASGYSSDPVMARYRQFGFKAAIAKPFQTVDLERAIQQTMTS